MAILMTKAEFGALCQISAPMVSKRARQGFLVLVGDKVDAAASLTNLEGRLEHKKWTAARDALEARKAARKTAAAPDASPPQNVLALPPAAASTESLADADPPEGDAEPVGWKARGDMFRAKEQELSYRERVGELTPAAEIGAAVEAVVASFWAETEQSTKIQAAEIASDLALDADQASKLRTRLQANLRDLRSNFTRAMERAEAEFKREAEAVA